jgi:D-glycero-alpha-D-manno-heptose 1-phosphate guanylyltransferase
MLEDLTCVLLVGGLGTRLRSVLPDTPKPMATVNGRPFLEYLIGQLRQSGLTDIILCVGHRAEAIEAHFGDGNSHGVQIRYSRERELLGTGGALSLAKDQIRSNPFLVMNGDSYCTVDFKSLLESHLSAGATVTVVAPWVEDQSRYGSLEIRNEDAIGNFSEKRGEATSGYINGGIYLIDRTVLNLVEPHRPCSLEKDILPSLIGQGLYAFKTSGVFIDIGIPSDLEIAQSLFSKVA